MKRKSPYVLLFLLLTLVSLLWAPLAAAQSPDGREYVVQANDSLSKIAKVEYGNQLAYASIIEATNAMAAKDDSFAVIDNPSTLKVGQKLWLPATPEDSGATVASTEAAADETEQDLLEIDPKNFDDPTNIDNEWWPLKPGTQLVYEGYTVENGEKTPHRIVDTVTDLTKVINGIRTVISFEEDYSDGQRIEQEIAFHAQDNEGNVWHLGQLRETYDDIEFVGGRVWLVGHLDGAKAGIRMQANPQLNTPGYSQGFAPAPFYWTDRARVAQMGQKTTVPTGSYDDVMVIEEWDQETEEGVFQTKYYARGVGVVRIGFKGPDPNQEEMELVELNELDAEAMAKYREEALKIEERAYIYATTPPAEQITNED